MLLQRLSGRSPAIRAGVGLTAAAGLAILTVLTWYAWLGRDHEYQIDPVTRLANGPYEASQVIGCLLTLLTLGIATGIGVHPFVPVAVPMALTAAWSAEAASHDGSGLWVVGAIMLLVGSTCAAGLITALSSAVLQARRHPVPGCGPG